MMAKILSINISKHKGTKKKPVDDGSVRVIKGYGVEGDAHGGDWHRQVSFLAQESIFKAAEAGLYVHAGDFAENFITEGIDIKSLPLGTRLKVGNEVVVEISQIGKVCHTRCAIYHLMGDCIFPREGVFGVVIEPGEVKCGDEISVVSLGNGTCEFTPSESIKEIEEAKAAGKL